MRATCRSLTVSFADSFHLHRSEDDVDEDFRRRTSKALPHVLSAAEVLEQRKAAARKAAKQLSAEKEDAAVSAIPSVSL